MTEPKMVHEWDSGETEYKLYDDGSLKWEQVDIGSRSICEGTLTPSSITRELARLAARVQELERLVEGYRLNALDDNAEITRLWEAVDRYGRHKANCAFMVAFGDNPCDCGFAAIKEKP